MNPMIVGRIDGSVVVGTEDILPPLTALREAKRRVERETGLCADAVFLTPSEIETIAASEEYRHYARFATEEAFGLPSHLFGMQIVRI